MGASSVSVQLETATLIVDLAIYFLLVLWMTLDRMNIYFRKEDE